MGVFSKPKVQEVQTTPAQQEAKTEKEETTAKKHRLLGTEGGSKGEELNDNQGRSIRHIFGN